MLIVLTQTSVSASKGAIKVIKKLAAGLLFLPLFFCCVPVVVFGWIGKGLADTIVWLTEE